MIRSSKVRPYWVSYPQFDPSGQTWKLLLQQGINSCTPRREGEWMPSLRWIFTSAPLTCPCSLFICSLLTVWRRLHLSLIQSPPSSRKEIDRQPLIWNGQVRDASRLQLGERSHISWDGWMRAPARSFEFGGILIDTWRQQHLQQQQGVFVERRRGAQR